MSIMEANKLEPFIPTHPGEVIKEEIEYRGISQRALAMQIGVSKRSAFSCFIFANWKQRSAIIVSYFCVLLNQLNVF